MIDRYLLALVFIAFVEFFYSCESFGHVHAQRSACIRHAVIHASSRSFSGLLFFSSQILFQLFPFSVLLCSLSEPDVFLKSQPFYELVNGFRSVQSHIPYIFRNIHRHLVAFIQEAGEDSAQIEIVLSLPLLGKTFKSL